MPVAGDVLPIEARRTQAESSEWAGALPKEEEDEEGDRTASGKLVIATKLAHEWVGVSSLTLVLSNRLDVVEVFL